MLDLTHHGAVTVLRMAHGKANALDLEFCAALTAQLDACERSPSTRALVMTGSGAMFSAGVDLLRVVDGGADYIRVFLPAMNRMFEKLFAFPKPVVAAVNGHAIAGGCILACAADWRLMSGQPGRIGIPELLVGVPFPVVPLEIVRFATPPQHLQKRAALPQLRPFALTARRVFFFPEADRLVLVPEEGARLVHRVQRVDHHERLAEWQPRFDATLAEGSYQRE